MLACGRRCECAHSVTIGRDHHGLGAPASVPQGRITAHPRPGARVRPREDFEGGHGGSWPCARGGKWVRETGIDFWIDLFQQRRPFRRPSVETEGVPEELPYGSRRAKGVINRRYHLQKGGNMVFPFFSPNGR